MYFTFSDAVEHALNWLGSTGQVDDRSVSDARRAAISGYRELAEAHPWTWYVTLGRLNLSAPYSTGAIGIADGIATLSNGTWPTWAATGTLRVGELLYLVRERTSDSVLSLDAATAPLEEIDAGTSYMLFQDTYVLPADWREGNQALHNDHFGGVGYVAPQDWLRYVRDWSDAGTPRVYTVTSDIRYPGRLVARLWPAPQEARTLDFVYRRSPRPLCFQSVRDGTVAVTQGSHGLTGVGTRFRPEYIGSVVRITDPAAVNPAETPTPEWGLNPYVHETRILGYSNVVAATMEATAPVTGNRLGYLISDPLDLNLSAMLTAYQRAIEWQMSLLRSMTDKPNPRAAWDRALAEAQAHDNVYSGPRVVREPAEASNRFWDSLYYGKINYGGI